ncbi:MAG: type IX secretion system protein PorQ [Cytophagales bacterium]|nr:type IX secretion system protein PorQ [Bernardetiaceae bacterium]MDW8203757.1 type IX secretion system protein PorQ [Cytophagales bacterium]
MLTNAYDTWLSHNNQYKRVAVANACQTFLLAALLPLFAQAQIGGGQSFSFLQLPPNTRTVAQGGVQVASVGKDASLWLSNPALNTDSAKHQATLQLQLLSGQALHTTLASVLPTRRHQRLAIGLQYIGYGQFEGFDATGAPTGSFTAAEYVLAFNYAHTLSPFTLGITLKGAGSSIATFQSVALLADIGALFQHPKKDLRIGLTMRNIGFAASNYTDASQWIMPFDAQVGISFRPEKMPLRFSLTAWQLAPRGDIVYNDPTRPTGFDLNGNPLVDVPTLWQKLARRLVVGSEWLLHPNLQLRTGYNVLHRQELGLPQRRALSGFSFGVMLSMKTIEISYSYQVRHVAGGISAFSIVADLSRISAKLRTRVEIDN